VGPEGTASGRRELARVAGRVVSRNGATERLGPADRRLVGTRTTQRLPSRRRRC